MSEWKDKMIRIKLQRLVTGIRIPETFFFRDICWYTRIMLFAVLEDIFFLKMREFKQEQLKKYSKYHNSSCVMLKWIPSP